MILDSQHITQAIAQADSLHLSGNSTAAEKVLLAVLAEQPTHPKVNYSLGVILLDNKRVVESLPYFNAALKADPAQEKYWLSYISSLIDATHYEDAQLVLSYGRNAGLNIQAVGQLEKLIELKQAKSLSLSKNLSAQGTDVQDTNAPQIAVVEGLIELFSEQRYQEIETILHELLNVYPDWLIGWKILSDTLLVQKKDARLAAFNALRLNHNDAKEHCYYGLVLKGQGDLLLASEAFRQAAFLKPDYAAAYNNLAIVSKDMGNIEEAITHYRRALELNPDYASCYSNLLFCLSHSNVISSQALFHEHCLFAKKYESKLKHFWVKHDNSRDISRRLKVGFVSADFREHSLTNFFEPVLNHLSNSDYLSLHAYFNYAFDDEVTERLRHKFENFIKVDTLSDLALAKKLREDKIDILVDLDGHTSNNRLLTFAMKPAPIQVSWLGYLATTGLTAMDYYLTDGYLAPPGLLDNQFTEKLIQLPANAPFMPSTLSPEINNLPAINNGFITFACFNRVEKMTVEVIRLWSKLLMALPTAKILLGAMPNQGSYDYIIQCFADNSITPDRLIFHPRSNMADYLKLHHQVDICLDTFPSNGVTTTCHAAWMGVPTLCITGDRLSSRGAMAVMSHLGLTEFIANNQDHFMSKAVDLLNDVNNLAKIRANLRTNFAQSALMQPQLIADTLETSFRAIWTTWCKKAPVKSFKTVY